MTAKKTKNVGAVSVEKTTTVYHETGVGNSDRTEVTYELGATIDGVFVPFTTLSENHVAGLVASGKPAASESPAEDDAE